MTVGIATGRGGDEFRYLILIPKENIHPYPYPNLTSIKLLSHPYPHRVTDIISYSYPYPFSYYFNINFN